MQLSVKKWISAIIYRHRNSKHVEKWEYSEKLATQNNEKGGKKNTEKFPLNITFNTKFDNSKDTPEKMNVWLANQH